MTMLSPQPINSSETHVLVARRSCALRCASDPISRCVVNLDATEHFYSEPDVSPVAETINKSPTHPIGKEEITAPCGTGSLRGIKPQRSLRNVDDDRDLIGHDRHADAVGPATDAAYHLLPEQFRVHRWIEKPRCTRTSRLSAFSHNLGFGDKTIVGCRLHQQ